MKNLAHILLALIFGLSSINAQAQILILEDFNNGFPAGWQSQPFLGSNQWNTTFNGGNNIDGSEMMMIQSSPGQPTVTELILPPFPPAPPGTIDIFMEFELNLVSEQNSVLKVIQIDDQNPTIPIELVELSLTSCDPIMPWNCTEPEVVTVPINNYDPQDLYIFVHEDFGGSGFDFCALDNFVLVANPCPIGLILDTNFPPTCHNGPDGLIQVTGILGIPPYIYSIDGGAGQASDTFNTTPGAHTITVVDAIGCTTTITVVVPNKADLIYNYVAAAPLCFNGNDATIVGAAAGGTPGYMYTIDGGAQQGNGNFTTTPGVHNIMVIDNVGCTKVFALTVPNAEPLGIQQTVFPPTCHDGPDGQISVTASGGTPAYTYSLDGGAAQGNGNFTTTAGVHTVTVTDANGCTKVFTITVPNSTNEITYNPITFPPTCFDGLDGSIIGAAAGGTPPYSYSINFGPPQGNGAFNNLQPGIHVITITDALDCQETFFILVPNVPDMVINFVHSAAVSCFGGADATISVTSVTNGVPPFTYTLNGAAGGPNWINQAPGAYTLVVTDSRPCSKTVTFTISEPAPLAIGAVINNVSCAGAMDGILTPVVGGGTPPLQTRLDGGAYGAPVNYAGLAPGLHLLEVKDFNGCTIGASWNVSQPLPLVSDTASVTPSSGTDGAIDVETNGGNPAYSYLWSNGETTQDIDGLPPGEYYVLTSDTKSCPSDTLFVTVPSSVDPTACVAANFTNAPAGLHEDQTGAGGTKTQLKWNHYGEATTGCIIKGGTIGTLDENAAYTQSPGQVLVQGVQVQGDVNGHDVSAQLAPNATFALFNPLTFPAGPTGSMVAGAFYKWQVRCGCIIDLSLPFPERLANSNVHLSPWSDFDLFTNLTPVVESGNSSTFSFNEKSNISLYPNPSQGTFNILFKDLAEGLVRIEIKNMIGEIVHSSSENISQNNQIKEMDLSEQSAGMYFIQVEQNSNVISSKMIIK